MIGLPLLLLSILLAIASALALPAAVAFRRPRLAVGILAFDAAWAAGYLGVLALVSAGSHERLLAMGEAKAFSGPYLDSHLHAAVEEVRTAATLGDPSDPVRAHGRFLIVRLRISSSAVRVAIEPGHLTAMVVDERGREYPRAPLAERALSGPRVRLEQAVAPGDYYDRTVVFDVPVEVAAPRLHVTEGVFPERLIELLLIGDEDSLFHRKQLFRLEPLG